MIDQVLEHLSNKYEISNIRKSKVCLQITVKQALERNEWIHINYTIQQEAYILDKIEQNNNTLRLTYKKIL